MTNSGPFVPLPADRLFLGCGSMANAEYDVAIIKQDVIAAEQGDSIAEQGDSIATKHVSSSIQWE